MATLSYICAKPVHYRSNDGTALVVFRGRDTSKEVLRLWPYHIGQCDREDVRFGPSSGQESRCLMLRNSSRWSCITARNSCQLSARFLGEE